VLRPDSGVVNSGQRCVQGKQVLKDGIGRATEVEEAVDPAAARSFLEHPEQLLELDSPLMQNAKR
jgi:hypothetical protein